MTYLLQLQHNKALSVLPFNDTKHFAIQSGESVSVPTCVNVYDIIGECEDVRTHTEWLSVSAGESAYADIPTYTPTALYIDLTIIALANLIVLLVFLYL